MPPVGNRPLFTAMTKKPSAKARSGITMSAAVPRDSRRSGKRPRCSALQIPRGSAIPQASSMAVMVKSKVLRSEEHTSELQSHSDLVCRLLLEKKKNKKKTKQK